MSGPITSVDVPPVAPGPPPSDAGVPAADDPPEPELLPGRQAEVGGLTVRRLLPKRTRRTVGAWCFVDHLGPKEVGPAARVEVGPHPHIGLATVTWLLAGRQVHRDSLGSEQVLRPGELNLMSAGRGVAHAEESEDYRGVVHGVQLWVAQPESTRHGDPAFAHHDDLPVVPVGSAEATVLLGALDGRRSPARSDTPLVGVDLAMRPGASVLPLTAGFEYGLVVLEGAVRVGSRVLRPGELGYLRPGRDELPLRVDEPARALVLGGEPFPEELLMWWNFVARTREEMDTAAADWPVGVGNQPVADGGGRFGPVASSLAPVPAPARPWSPRA